MTRDMKPRKAPEPRSSGSTLMGVFIGLVLGVVVALAVALYVYKGPSPFKGQGKDQAPDQTAAAQPSTNPQAQPPMALPGKPGDPVSDKPRFDFYKILPGNADAVPDPKAADNSKDAKKDDKGDAKSKDAKKGGAKDGDSKDSGKTDSASKDSGKGNFVLQAGSFQKAGEADNQKANLAMMGVEAAVQQVMVGDKTWYRVRLGPFSKIEDVNRVRQDLAKAGIDVSLVKNKD